MPWQQYVADVAFELNPDGSFAYSEVDLEVGRQEGKTALKFVVAVHRLAAMVQTHGPQRVTYTMQNRAKARTRLERDYAPRLRTSKGFKEIPAVSRVRPTRPTQWRLGMNSGVEHIQFGPASYLQIDTPSREGGHGDTLNLGLIDEAFAHEDDTVELAMEPALLIPQDSQLWVMSAGGDAKSKYLYRKILAGRKLVEDGADTGTAYFEWSAHEDDDPSDPGVWARCCPALGFTIDESKLAARWQKAERSGPEAIDSFRRSYLSQWPEIPLLDELTAQWTIVSRSAWESCADPGHEHAGRLSFALDVDTNAQGEEWCSVGASDGSHVEVVEIPAATAGLGWVVSKLVERRSEFDEIALDPSGPAGKLIIPLESAGVKVRQVKSAEFVQACGQLVDAVNEDRLVHAGQPVLDRAVAGAARKDVGDGAWRLSRSRSPVDISPLVAVAIARFVASTADDGGDFLW